MHGDKAAFTKLPPPAPMHPFMSATFILKALKLSDVNLLCLL